MWRLPGFVCSGEWCHHAFCFAIYPGGFSYYRPRSRAGKRADRANTGSPAARSLDISAAPGGGPIFRGRDRRCRPAFLQHDLAWISFGRGESGEPMGPTERLHPRRRSWRRDRKSTRLNSSHVEISYAVFCLKKKKKKKKIIKIKKKKKKQKNKNN